MFYEGFETAHDAVNESQQIANIMLYFLPQENIFTGFLQQHNTLLAPLKLLIN